MRSVLILSQSATQLMSSDAMARVPPVEPTRAAGCLFIRARITPPVVQRKGVRKPYESVTLSCASPIAACIRQSLRSPDRGFVRPLLARAQPPVAHENSSENLTLTLFRCDVRGLRDLRHSSASAPGLRWPSCDKAAPCDQPRASSASCRSALLAERAKVDQNAQRVLRKCSIVGIDQSRRRDVSSAPILIRKRRRPCNAREVHMSGLKLTIPARQMTERPVSSVRNTEVKA
jgi:hypothetical protein